MKKILSSEITVGGSIFCSFLLGFCLLLAFSGSSLFSNLSIFDEAQHIDYSIHLASGQLPTFGTKLTDTTRRIIYCLPDAAITTNGMNNISPPATKCSSSTNIPADVPHGFNYEVQQPPLGYLPYVAIWNIFNLGSKNPATQLLALRLGNVFWAAATILSLLLLYRRIRPQLNVAIAGVFFIGLNPLILFSYSYVTNDVPAVTLGLLAVNLLYYLIEKIDSGDRKKAIVLYCLFGILLSLFRTTFILIPMILLIGIFVNRRKLSNYKDLIRIHLIQLLLFFITSGIYQFVIRVKGTVSAQTVLHVVNPTSLAAPLTFNIVTSTISAATGVFNPYWTPAPGSPFALIQSSGPTIVFLFLCAGITLVSFIHPLHLRDNKDLVSVLAQPAVSSFFMFSIGFTLIYYLLNEGAQWAPPRYLLPAIPFLLVPALIQLKTNEKFLYLFNTVGIICLLSLHFQPL